MMNGRSGNSQLILDLTNKISVFALISFSNYVHLTSRQDDALASPQWFRIKNERKEQHQCALRTPGDDGVVQNQTDW